MPHIKYLWYICKGKSGVADMRDSLKVVNTKTKRARPLEVWVRMRRSSGCIRLTFHKISTHWDDVNSMLQRAK